MAPSKWDDEEEESTPPSSPPVTAAIPRRNKFDDEEDDSDVLDSWDAAEDSEAEREKAKKAAEEKARADALAKASKKSRAQRIEEHREANRRRRAADDDEESDESEDEGERRRRMRQQEKEGDLQHAEDLFGNIGISNKRSAGKPITVADPTTEGATIDLSTLAIFNPTTLNQFTQLRETLAPLLNANAKKPQYPGFATEFVKLICRDMQSDQIKKVASGLTTLSNEKMKEEKAAEKGGKKTKAAKSKTTLNASRETTLKADTNAYDDGLDDDDFM